MQPEGRPHVSIPSPRLTLAKFHEGFVDPPRQPLYSSLSPWVVGRAIVDRHVESFAEVLGNLCGELRARVAAQRQGYPNVNRNSRSFLATFSAVLLGSG